MQVDTFLSPPHNRWLFNEDKECLWIIFQGLIVCSCGMLCYGNSVVYSLDQEWANYDQQAACSLPEHFVRSANTYRNFHIPHFKLLQAVALNTFFARFQALALDQLLSGQCSPIGKKFAHPWFR